MTRKIIVGASLAVAACLLVAILLRSRRLGMVFARRQPAATSQQLYEGVDYERIVRRSPRPMVIHIVTVDLRTEDIRFLVTPGDPESALPLKARTTSQFLNEFDQQIAINGDGFQPWHSYSIFNYYPHRGDPVAPIGVAASEGTIYHTAAEDLPVLYVSRTNQARFNTPIGRVYNAISGSQMLVEGGQASAISDENPQPRTAVALDKAGKRLIIILVDGRQPNYSEGATLAELAEIIIEQGGYFGMNLDGGGSTTLVKEGRLGRAEVLNSPIDHRIPGWQRPVGNHLGISANSK